MKQNKIPFILILILLFLFSEAKSQNIQGTVKDIKSQIPVPYTEILTKTFGGITNKNGKFKIPKNLLNKTDSVYFRCVGYKTKAVSANELLSANNNSIFLENSYFKIKKVIVKAKKKVKTRKIGIYKKRVFGGYSILNSSKVALYIENKKEIKGILKNVQFYFRKFGFPARKYRIHLYEAKGKDNPPGKEILPEAIYGKGAKGEDWVVIDMQKYNIKFPATGIFVAIQGMPDSMYIERKGQSGACRNETLLNLGLAQEKVNQGYTWTYRLFNDNWTQFLPPKKDSYWGNAMIAAEIIIKK